MIKHKVILNLLLILSIILILWINFIEFKIPFFFPINYDRVNFLIQAISLAYLTSFLFYYVVVRIKEKDERKVIYPFIADYTYVMMNNCIYFSLAMRNAAKMESMPYDTTIHNRNLKIYPNIEDMNLICKTINPNEKIYNDIGLEGFKTIPHFIGIMIKYVHEIDYFLNVLLEKSPVMEIELLRILTDIKTSGYHKDLSSFDKSSIFTATHRHDNLMVYKNSFQHYFELFIKLENYADNNLKKYVERESLKHKINC